MEKYIKVPMSEWYELRSQVNEIYEAVKLLSMKEGNYIKVVEAADIIGVSRDTVYRMIRDGTIRATVVNGVKKINITDLRSAADRGLL